MMPEAAPARRRRSVRWPSEGEARPAGAMPAFGGGRPVWRPCSWLASACSALPPGAVGLSGQTPNFGFRIPDFKIENSVFESGVSSPVPGHARIRMRVSRRRHGGGESCCAPGSSLDWGLQRLAGSGVRRLLCGLCGLAPGAQRRRRHSGAMADSARGRPDGKRERKRAQTVWRGGFRRGRVRPTPIPPGRLLTSDCRGSVRRQRISRHVCRKFWPKRLGMVRRSGLGLPCPIGSSLAQSHCAPGANGPGLRTLAFRLWHMALALPPLPFPPLLSSSFSPGASGCPGA